MMLGVTECRLLEWPVARCSTSNLDGPLNQNPYIYNRKGVPQDSKVHTSICAAHLAGLNVVTSLGSSPTVSSALRAQTNLQPA
jgi:hypothetical protein